MDEYYCLDARKLHEIVKPSSVQVVITSPPYFDVKNYGKNSYQIGWKQDYDSYIADIRDILHKCFEATVTTGTMWVVADTYKREGRLKLLPLDLMKVLEEVGWIPQDIIIWDKVKNLPYSSIGQFRNNFEYILVSSKTQEFKYYIDRIREIETLKQWWMKYPERYNPMGKVPENIWRISIPNQGTWSNGAIQHLCPFPPELVERIISLSTDENDLVLDPFAGSGVVLAQAKCMNRKYIGFDIYQELIDRFYSKVLPEVEERYREKKGFVDNHLKMQRGLNRTIISLRKLKFGKVLLKKLISRTQKSDFKLIIVDSRDKDDYFSVSFDMIVVVTQEKVQEQVVKLLPELVASGPLSKYGLSPSLKVISDAEVSEYVKDESRAIYLEGKFWDEATGTNVSTVLGRHDHRFPPIISDIHVSRDLFRETNLPYTKLVRPKILG